MLHKIYKGLLASFLILISIAFPSFLQSRELPCTTPPYIVITMAKGGSHLLFKLISMLSTNPQRNLSMENDFYNETHTFPPHQYATLDRFIKIFPALPDESILAHLNHGKLMREFASISPNYKRFLLLRDPRDVCISTVFFTEKVLDEELGLDATFEERLMYVIKADGYYHNSVFDIKLESEEALIWMQDPLTTVCRFEKLCGTKGGGTKSLQISEILKITTSFGILLQVKQLNDIIDNLWGGTPTFRKGQIGEWKESFTEEHKTVFKERMGDILIKLGYETSYDW